MRDALVFGATLLCYANMLEKILKLKKIEKTTTKHTLFLWGAPSFLFRPLLTIFSHYTFFSSHHVLTVPLFFTHPKVSTTYPDNPGKAIERDFYRVSWGWFFGKSGVKFK